MEPRGIRTGWLCIAVLCCGAALILKKEEPGHQSTTQRDDVLEHVGEPTTTAEDVDKLTRWPTATPMPPWTTDTITTSTPTRAGAVGNKTRESHRERKRCDLGMCHHPWRVLHPPQRPPSAWHRPQPPLRAACPHLLSLPVENTSAVPIRYWSPAIFVVVALLVLFFTYRRTKGEGTQDQATPASDSSDLGALDHLPIQDTTPIIPTSQEKKGPEKPSEHTETTFCEPDPPPPQPLPPQVFHPNALNPSAWQGGVLVAESQPLQPMQVPGEGL
ncbi:uncharacterized protein ACIBXB_019298 isoform 2-T2 [Morphnus guianensis]